VFWIPVGAWVLAVLVAAVVLGFCGYEVLWKLGRLRTNLTALQTLGESLVKVGADLSQAVQRRHGDGPA
jgi:ABC-type uncharacterized transport system permease subunit